MLRRGEARTQLGMRNTGWGRVKVDRPRGTLESEEAQGGKVKTSNHCRNLESSSPHSQVWIVKFEAGDGGCQREWKEKVWRFRG